MYFVVNHWMGKNYGVVSSNTFKSHTKLWDGLAKLNLAEPRVKHQVSPGCVRLEHTQHEALSARGSLSTRLTQHEALSVLMLCAHSNRRRPFSYYAKMADFEYFRV